MAKADSELQELMELFAPGNGFGDSEERRNAEFRVQVALAEQQRKTNARLNVLTALGVVIALLQAVIAAYQVWR